MNKPLWFLVILVLYITFHYLIGAFALSSVAKIRVITEAGHEEPIKIYYSSAISQVSYSEKRSILSTRSATNGKVSHVAYPNNRIIRGLRLDPLKGEGDVKIYSIEILSHFGRPLFFDAEGIVQHFTPRNATMMKGEGDFAVVRSAGSDPQLSLDGPVRFDNFLLSYLLPIFLALISALILKSIKLGEIHAIKDITTKTPSTARNITSLDGLRGLAALLVIADHTGYHYFKGLGAVGVWIFFCLSGFLLSIPFVKNPSLIVSHSYLQHYVMRRVKRIVPMYYFVLTLVFLFRGNLENYFRHIIFIQGDGIYWSIPQEMFFYLILPLVFMLNYLVCRTNILLMLFSTVVIAVLLNHFISVEWLSIYGNGRRLPLVPEIFIMGIALSYLYHSPYADFIANRPKLLHDIGGIVVLAAVLLSSDGFLAAVLKQEAHYAWNSEIFGYLAALLLFFSISHPGSLLPRILSYLPLRAVGIVGFSFYLIHPKVLGSIEAILPRLTGQELSPMALLLIGIPLTYFFSAITYGLIERPFIRKSTN